LREGVFIRKNRERWERVQKELPSDPDQLASEFVKLTDDLGYAKTFYPNSAVTRFLNTTASRIYLKIYGTREENRNRLVEFWRTELPRTIYRHRRILLLSLAVFLVFFFVGFFSASRDPRFIREVLSEDYVTMTMNNIEAGQPFGVYGSYPQFIMFIMIMVNNIMVSFMYFFKGILLGIPSMLSLGQESIRIGAFEYMFYSRGLGGKAVTTVLIHGIFELTAIIIACGAGLVMGVSPLFPGTGSRWDSFRRGVKDGIKMVFGLIPTFAVAAFYESYFTRHYTMPAFLNWTILISSLAFVFWYFVIYPYKVSRNAL
jgi:uncharacterized membrane protein SpoIIM required for sporulation